MPDDRDTPDDRDLLARIGQGDQSAFKALLDRHARYLFGVAHAMTGHASDAEDVVQETLVALLGASTKFRGESSVRTWLVRILVNKVRMQRRSGRKHQNMLSIDAIPTEPGSLASASGSVPRGPSGPVDAKIDLTQMLAQLSEEHRQVIILRELQGMSYEEMARALNVPRGTVESRLFRAREELRKRFKGYAL